MRSLWSVSIHAPRAERDKEHDHISALNLVSIHAPRAERDVSWMGKLNH